MFNDCGCGVIGQSLSSLTASSSSPHVGNLGPAASAADVEKLEMMKRFADWTTSTSVITTAGDVQASLPCTFTVEQVVCVCEVLLASAQVILSLANFTREYIK